MKTNFFSVISTTIYLSFIFSTVLTTGATKPIKSPSVIPIKNVNSFDQYHQECLQRVDKQGLTKDVAKDVCNCTMKTFKSQYNIQQFKAIVQKANTDKTSARKLANVGETCFEKVLYEE